METSNLVSHALVELQLAYRRDCDVLEGVDLAEVLRAVKAFSEEGHSGSSAPFGANTVFNQLLVRSNRKTAEVTRTLLAFEPVTPLTGEDNEWFVHDFSDEAYAQNVRCSHVFKRRDGTAYDINAVVFRDPDDTHWTNSDSRRDVTFPYTPKSEVVDRASSAA